MPMAPRTPVELILRTVDYGGRPHYAIAVRDLQARKQAEQHIRFLAHHDSLTGIPNRSTFNKKLDQEIESALETGRRLAVLCLDLDRFKEVNDLFGHAAGDATLQAVAKRIAGMLDESHMLARLSGDEFAIILPAPIKPRRWPDASQKTSWRFSNLRVMTRKQMRRSPRALESPYVRMTRPIGRLCSLMPILHFTARKMRDEEPTVSSKPRWAPPSVIAVFWSMTCATRFPEES